MNSYDEIQLLDQFQEWRQNADQRALSYMPEMAFIFLEEGKTIIEAGDAWEGIVSFIGGLKPAVDVTARSIIPMYKEWLKLPRRDDIMAWYSERETDGDERAFADFVGGVLARSTIRITIK